VDICDSFVSKKRKKKKLSVPGSGVTAACWVLDTASGEDGKLFGLSFPPFLLYFLLVFILRGSGGTVEDEKPFSRR